MNEQQMREIAKAAFKRQFGDTEIVRINVRPEVCFVDYSSVVDVNIIYDDESGRVTGRGLVSAQTELVDKTWREGRRALGYPCVNFIAKSGLGRRDPATV